MAAPLITRTPIHDDDLSGETGTILDNAWKQELYGQIDADVAAVVAAMPVLPPSNVLYKSSGVNSSAAYSVLGNVVMPPMSQNDYLTIVVNCYQAAQTGGTLTLTSTGDAALIRLDDIGGGSLVNSAMGNVIITMRMNTTNSHVFNVVAMGGFGGGICGMRQAVGQLTKTPDWLSGGWTLAIEEGPQTAGGTTYWGMSVLRF